MNICRVREHKVKMINVKITIYKTLHIKLKIEEHEPHSKPGVNAGAPEG
jgi:hypothetical protein